MPHHFGSAFEGYNVYYGDIHNHCDLSYGHGSLDNALQNARLQLDFVSVTVHAVWPDIPTDDPQLSYLIDYHEEGFTRAKSRWVGYLRAMENANQDGHFVTFPSFEWHSIQYGDYCVYYRQVQDDLPIIDAPDLESLRESLRQMETDAILIPHHIGYRQGSRGINWAAFTDELSPVAEIFSFHGASETSTGPYPYLHSMGPRHEHSTAQYGWAQGNVFGVIGSTDHHNAFPGSYGYGRLAVIAQSLSRDAIWEAIQQRRTYALTGDRIELGFTLNGTMIGGLCPAQATREIAVSVHAGDRIDTIDVLHNNQVIHRESILPQPVEDEAGRYKVFFEMGWGERDDPFDWDVTIEVEEGQLLAVEPRLRGLSPIANDPRADFAYTTVESDENQLRIHTKTRRNLSLHTPATEGVLLEIDGSERSHLCLTVNGQQQRVALRDLRTGARSFYTGGFVSPAYCLHQAVPQREYQHTFTLTHHHDTTERDWYYVRVRQRNDQWAWSSPIWVEGKRG